MTAFDARCAALGLAPGAAACGSTSTAGLTTPAGGSGGSLAGGGGISVEPDGSLVSSGGSVVNNGGSVVSSGGTGGSVAGDGSSDRGDTRSFRLATSGAQLVVSGPDLGLQLTAANVAEDADVMDVHQEFYGVPWDEFAAGTPPPAEWVKIMDRLHTAAVAAHDPVFLSISMLVVSDLMTSCPCTFDTTWCSVLDIFRGAPSTPGTDTQFYGELLLKAFGTMGLRRYDGTPKPEHEALWTAARRRPIAP